MISPIVSVIAVVCAAAAAAVATHKITVAQVESKLKAIEAAIVNEGHVVTDEVKAVIGQVVAAVRAKIS